MLLFNVFIQNTYVSLHLFINSILLYIIIYKAVFLVPVVLFSMVPGGGVIPGASGGGASRLVEVPSWCQWLPGSSPAYSQPDT